MMSNPINYSKWNNIEVSDDEDDTHPNIDTPSLFKWRHEARVERMKVFEAKKKEVDSQSARIRKTKAELEQKLKNESLKGPDLESMKKALNDIKKEDEHLEKKMAELAKEERLQPWNVDTLSKDGFSKTAINKTGSYEKKELTEDEKAENMKEFVKSYKNEIEKYGMFSKFDDSKNYLLEHKHLACEETANYLVIQCINYAMEEKFSLMEHVAHQVISMQYLLELAKQLDTDPRACISSFFSKIQFANDEYKKAFFDELEAFKARIRKRAKEKIEEQIKEMQENEELEPAPIGPGGLDPVEVFNSLPESLQKCFESQDIGMLQQAIKELPDEEGRYHMKRCIDSGLWLPSKEDPNTNPEDGFIRHADEEALSDESEEEEKNKS
ncbi:hsp90 co-chaperone Cdc37 [Lepeophtheirus salmonis]|uniref:Hsp90 co-chaperone Cdc37 n=1 Tax=Lepeophtheirus salmonis TaxID=72036 RepID=C1BSQ2_LEPSM|nr:hsp90 co-chaperone Cdc37-like [Lepeophtheirus salmonis]ACO12055.1 Hsp90 co-chaperone Cdc37 [Lepeophtheirus salmonis]ADD38887.1 Hsp90 co-chaperone Cdc37 [Lepeophtheirus salmonis]